ncbi:MAG: thioredoxin domain-containing protein [Cyanobacteria bacterium J06626_4]
MSDSSPKIPAENSPNSAKAKATNWPLWLGIGFFGAVGAALLISLTTSLGGNSTAPLDAEAPTAAPTPVTAPPANQEEHQVLVTEVVDDLSREILVGDSPTLGNPDATVVLLKFSDYQCGFCNQATGHIDEFLAEHDNDVLFVLKNFPLTNIHPEALPAALASWAAGQQGQFWAYHDALFENQPNLGEGLYLRIARDLDLDLDQFNTDRASEDAKKAVARDLALAQELQLSSTPTFIMNDVLIPGAVPADFLSEALVRVQAAQ